MIRRHMIMSAAATTLALASCSGGDNDASPTPTPTSTSTATPTPTPTASPTYTAFPLTTATEFNTINASTSYTGDPTAGAVTLGVSSTESLSTRVRLATAPAIATGTFVAVESTQESRFTTTNATVQPTPAVEEYVFRTDDTATAGKFAQLEFLNNTIASQVTSNADLQLTNVSYATWWRGDSTAGTKRITSTIWGYQTVLSDMPTSPQHSGHMLTGVLLSLACAASYAGVIVGGRTLSQRCSPVQVNAVAFGVGALLLLACSLTTPLVFNYSPICWLLLFYLGCIPTALAYLLFQSGMRATPATLTSILTLAEPLTAAILAWIIFDERLSFLGIIGAILLLGTILLLARAPKPATA